MPYYKKLRELRITLDSFVYHYSKREDTEILIVVDKKTNDIKDLLTLVSNYQERLKIRLIDASTVDNGYNPAVLFNLGVQASNGTHIVLTNPECAHSNNILEGFDIEFSKRDNIYLVCNCRNISVDEYTTWENLKFKNVSWYQNPQFKGSSKFYHFCSCLTRENFTKIGGFDENFSKGVCYDDDDFRDSVKDAGIEIIAMEDLEAFHIKHDNSFNLKNHNELVAVNKKYYLQKKSRKNNFKLGIGLPLTDDKLYSYYHDSWVLMDKPDNFVYIRPMFPGRIDDVRNDIVEQALRNGCTHLLMMDTDQTYPPDTIVKLMNNCDKDVVGGMVCKRYPNFDPILMRGSIGKYRYVSSEEIDDSDGLIEVDATGTGCIMFKTDIFFKLEKPWFEMTTTKEGKPVGEDICFCSKLRNAGYKIYVDTTLRVGHLSTVEITYDFYKFWKIKEELKNRRE